MPDERRRSTRRRRGFTLIEVMVAGVLTAFLLGSVALSLGQVGRAKSMSKERLDAYLRANAALGQIRADVATLVRSDDLYHCRFLLTDDTISTPLGDMDRDEILVFNTRLRPIRAIDFSGEGMEYETQYRVDDQGVGTMLWQRRDPLPDAYPDAGGMVSPIVENVLGLRIEAYDGEQWWDEWDSDSEGLPHAVRITVTASGARPEQYPEEAAIAILRTVVAIDRIMIPAERSLLTEEELELLDARELLTDADAAGTETPTDEGAEGGDVTGTDRTGRPGGTRRGGGDRRGGANPGGTNPGGGQTLDPDGVPR